MRRWKVRSRRPRRGFLATTAATTLILAGTVTPAEASPMELARRTAAATLAEVRAAAAVHDQRVAAETRAPEPNTSGRIEAGKPSAVEDDELGAGAAFSGFSVSSDLTVTVGAAPANALRAARSEISGGGAVVSEPVEIRARDREGKDVTSFPAKKVKTRGGGDDGPVVSDVVPGVSLTLRPDLERVTANDLNPATLRIYTRESAGEGWAPLPSYYDAAAGVVRAESSHLSQFVVIGIPFPVPAAPVVVLDPDNDDGHASTPAPPVRELAYNMELATRLQTLLQNDCRADVVLTRDASNPMVSRAMRAAIAAAHDPALTLGIGFNTNEGTAWGDPANGGSQVYSRGHALDDAVSGSLVGVLPTYTGRPAKNMGDNGNFPGAEFAGLPNAFTHLEALFLDHNYDRAVIDGGMAHIANGVLTGLGLYLESQGFDCTDPVTGGWPTPPSQAELQRWRDLGHQNYLTYGGDPVSFSTGNLVEDEKLFTLPGRGGQLTDLTLTYNSMDGRLSRIGAGWSFGLGARAQRFIDGSVLVQRGDGASYVFTSDGNGGYTGEPGVQQTLVEAGGGLLTLTASSGESWVFDAGDIDGIGELVTHTDAQGNATTLAYGPSSPDTHQFVPLASITDAAGQTIQVESDGAGRVSAFVRPGGDRWTLAYNAAGDLTTITSPDGRTKSFAYDAGHRMLTATDPTGAVYLKNEYDDSGRVARQWDADGNERAFDYSKPGQTSYRDNLGRVSVFAFDDRNRITKVTHADGTTASFTFDAQNNVTSSTDENGAATRYEYDAAGNLTVETGPDGQVVRYTYTAAGDVATKTDRGGPKGAERTWSYDYDGSGRLVAVHQPDDTTIAQTYDADGNLAVTVQPSGASTTFGYDHAGNLTSRTDPLGHVTTFAYDAAGRMTSQTDPNGNTTSYVWDAGDRLVTVVDPAGGSTSYGWEPNDHLASVTDPAGAVSTFSWDAMFHLTASTGPTGGVTAYAYTAEDALKSVTDPLGNVTAYRTDERDRVVATTDPNGGVWRSTYDAVGNLSSKTSPSGAKTTYRYDGRGNLVKETDPTGASTTYAYDAVNRLVARTDADGVATKYGYDLLDRVTRVTDGIGKRTTLGYDIDGNLTSITDRTGAVTAYHYDAAGRVVAVTTPLGERTAYAYDASGNVTSVTDPLGRVSSYEYTPLGRVSAVTDAAGASTSFTYDATGRRLTVTDANGHTTSYTYDAAGARTSSTDPTGATTRYGWDVAGRQTSLTDAEGHVTQYGYDPAGQLVGVVENVTKTGKPGADANATSEYAYDADGNLASVSDPNGHIARYASDASGRTTAEINAVGNTTRTEYTAAGRVAAVVNGAGAVTRYQYDKRGDLVRQNQAGFVASYEYDPEQRLIAMTDPTGVSGWIYDANGRATTQIDQRGGRLVAGFDAAGQRTALTLPTGEQLGYTYDTGGRMTSQSSPWGDLAYQWDAAGNLTGLSRSTGVATAYSYDAANRVTGIVHKTPEPPEPAVTSPTPTPAPFAASDVANACTTVAGYLSARSAPAAGESSTCKHANTYVKDRNLPVPANPVADGGSLALSYAYDADGNVTKATRTISDGQDPAAKAAARVRSVAYGYDGLDRLVSSVASTGEKNAYAYDPAGNRTGWTRSGAKDGDFSQSASFSDANQLLRSETTGSGRGVADGVATYSYDGAGMRTSQSVGGVGTSYAYDPTGRTAQVTRDGRSTSYAYDGLGRRSSTTDQTRFGTQTTVATFDGAAVVQQSDELHGSTSLLRDAAGNLATHVASSGEATWDLLDGLGSAVAGAAGSSITQLAWYEDWGELNPETGAWSSPVGFTGQSQDPTQGLVHNQARSYDTGTGSWTAADTWAGLLVQPQSLARYGYVWDNPATYLDPDGHLCARRGPGDALPLGCGAPPVQAYQNVTMPPPAPPYVPTKAAKPQPTGPTAQNKNSERHECPAGQQKHISPYVNPQCVNNAALAQEAQSIERFFDVLGWIGAFAGLASLLPGMQWLAPIALVASAASTIYSCVKGGQRAVGCVIGIITTAVPGGGQLAGKFLRNQVEDWVSEAITHASKALGASGDALGVAQGWGS
ncbi:RHS repeat-associated core domain-containing protein [uncultured Leifsonia sp.]|uniref:RHS repeat-associated core domain-containing protein n=1 Tax=uncultured Leifsonia sp. TaxID=340359 RepID=UPI0025FFB2E7|nr:RHS repeat-associated core domain-containing protein [uncultured Leifsonia sp.]